jgi:transcriptional regulator, araC family
MKIITTTFDKNEDIYIYSYGYESISENAHWGKGCRDVYILHYVLSGEGYFNGRKVTAGEVFFITPKKLHQYHSSKDKPWKYFWVTFNGDMAKDLCKRYICADENGIFEFNFKTKLLGLADNILAEESPINSARALGYFFLLMSYHEKKDEFCGNYYIQEAKKYMEINFHRNISIVEVAGNIGISDRYLYNLFIKYEGLSPKKYLNNLKLKRAKSMLKSSSLSISEIAVSCGFDDVLAFSKFFSKKIGTSPTNFKRLHS